MTPIRHLRWYIGGLLFLSTVINYIDRQTLSVLAPYLKVEYNWSNADFAWVLIAFRVAYTIGQTIAGRMVDRLGTRVGLSLAVVVVLGRGDGDVDGGRSAQFLRVPLRARARRSGQLARRDQGGLGMVSAARKRLGGRAVRQRLVDRRGGRAVHRPHAVSLVRQLAAGVSHHRDARVRVAAAVPRAVSAARGSSAARRRRACGHSRQPWRSEPPAARRAASCRIGVLLRLPQTWGYVISKACTDPVWFFITDWFAIYLVTPRLQARRDADRLLGAVSGRRPRELLRRRAFEPV